MKKELLHLCRILVQIDILTVFLIISYAQAKLSLVLLSLHMLVMVRFLVTHESGGRILFSANKNVTITLKNVTFAHMQKSLAVKNGVIWFV